jgi:hypothetical protein
MKRFLYVLKDRGNCELTPLEVVEAKNFGHALQKLAARLPEPDREVHEIQIWRGPGWGGK